MAAIMHRTAGTPTDIDKCTWSLWLKRGKLTTTSGECFFGTPTAPGYIQYRFGPTATTNQIRMEAAGVDGGGFEYLTNRLFRDTNAWYHIVIAQDSTQAAAGDRVKLYINGVQETSFATQTNWQLNSGIPYNASGAVQYIGSYDASSTLFTGLMSHFHFIDGTQYAASDFGSFDATSGIWTINTAPSVTYGNNGFFLKMEDRTNLDLDSSPNAHTFTTTGTITPTYDNPSNNFSTLNNLSRTNVDFLTQGNNTISLTSYDYNTVSSLAMEAGKWYWEVKISDTATRVGVTTYGRNINLDADSGSFYWGSTGNGGMHILETAASTTWSMKNNDTSVSSTSYTTAISATGGDIVMVALDVDSGKMYMGLNGTWFNSSDPAAGTNPVQTIVNSSPDPLCVYAGMATASDRNMKFNFGNGYFGTTAVTSTNADDAGEGSFEYDVPTGYYALCTKNIKAYGG